MKSKTILILRGEEDSGELAEAIKAKGFEPLIEPVLQIEFLDVEFPDIEPMQPLVITSANGVRALAAKTTERRNPVFAVGANTADEARRVGFVDIQTAAGTAEDLVELLLQAHKTGLMTSIYIRATDISKDLVRILSKNGMNMEEFVAYEAKPAQYLSINLLRRLDNREIDAVMAFSVRGGKTFAELAEQYDRVHRLKSTKALCISNAVVESVSVLPFQQTLVADTPDRYGMMKLLEDLS